MNLKDYYHNIRAWIKIARTPHAAAWMKIVQDVMNFANEVHTKKKPMLTQICGINMGPTNSIMPHFDIVSLWAGAGDQNPITRLKHLREQINGLRELLIEAKARLPDTEESNDLIMNINIFLRVTE